VNVSALAEPSSKRHSFVLEPSLQKKTRSLINQWQMMALFLALPFSSPASLKVAASEVAMEKAMGMGMEYVRWCAPSVMAAVACAGSLIVLC